MLGLGLALPLAPLLQQSWGPQQLWGGGRAGLLLDPSSMAAMFQDAAGSTPVMTEGQPVGRVQDLSGEGRHLLQFTSSARPTYRVDGAGRPYLEFDGVDDFLASDVIAWGSDEVTLLVAMRKRSDVATQVVAEFGPNTLATDGTFGLLVRGADIPGYRSRSRGTASSELTLMAGYPADGSAHVVTITAKVATDEHKMRINAVQVGTLAADQGGGGFGTQQMFIGRRGGTSLSTAMDLYGLVILNRVLSPSELALAEKWAASRIGVAL